MLHAVEFVVFWNFLTQVMFHAKKCCNLWYGLLILFPGILSLKTFLEASKLHKYLDSIIVMPGNSDDGWQVDVSPPSLRCNAMLYCCHWYLYTTTSQSKPDLSPWDNMLSRLFVSGVVNALNYINILEDAMSGSIQKQTSPVFVDLACVVCFYHFWCDRRRWMYS